MYILANVWKIDCLVGGRVVTAMTKQSLTGESLTDIATAASRDEFTDYTIYLALSKIEKNARFREALKGLAETERAHYDFWRGYASEQRVKVSRLRVYFILLLRLILGLTFTLKFLERHEGTVIRRYREVASSIPAVDKDRFEEIVGQEEEHENFLMGGIEEGRVKYMSFIVLGLADAVVEVAAIHAGSLGIYDRTEIAGLAGVIAGMAASIAMASAAYAQAKQGFSGSARWSAIYTGVTYMLTATTLALPYFLTRSMLAALTASLAAGIVLVAFITYYDTVISGRAFRRQFTEITAIIFGATVALYIVGTVIRNLFGISI